jgi:hypothetical protein
MMTVDKLLYFQNNDLDKLQLSIEYGQFTEDPDDPIFIPWSGMV